MLFKDSLIFVFFISSSEINFVFFRFNFPLKLRFIFLSNAVNSKSFSPKTFFCNESKSNIVDFCIVGIKSSFGVSKNSLKGLEDSCFNNALLFFIFFNLI